MGTAFKLVFIEPAKTILAQIGNLLAGLVLVVLTLVVGWLIARLIKFVVIKVLSVVKLDELLDKVNINEFLEKGGIKYSFSELIGIVCYWLTLLVALIIAVNNAGITIGSDLLNRIILYIPNIFVAVFILIVGIFAATFLSTIVQAFANNAGITQSKILSKIAAVVVTVFAVIIALEELHIATATLVLTLNIILASVGLAFALAFGLGCRDLAEKFVAELVEKLRAKK